MATSLRLSRAQVLAVEVASVDPIAEGAPMKFVVKPVIRTAKWPPYETTMCALCSEDPRFCGDEI